MNRPLNTPIFKCVVTTVVTGMIAAVGAFGQTTPSPTINDTPSRQFGQSPNVAPLNQPLNSTAPNLAEGRELNLPSAVAFDTKASPPIMYVADTFNNRVLAFKNPNRLAKCGISAPTCGFADLVIGQRDFFATFAGGPNRQGINDGFALPTSVAVDGSGNLYVLDSVNNRIMRFPSPFKQTVSPVTSDLVIGQKTKNSGTTYNQGNLPPDGTTLYFNAGGAVVPIGMAFDPSGNLWVSDWGNNRVLRFPASVLVAGNTLPSADLVLGQQTLSTTAPLPTCSYLIKTCISQPTAITIDAAGGIYLADIGFGARMLYFTGPIQANGIQAARILGLCEGIAPLTPANCNAPNQYGVAAGGLFNDGQHLFVSDAANNRIVEYDVPSKWPPAPAVNESPQTHFTSPPILAAIGQVDFLHGKANKGQTDPDSTTLSVPLGGAFNGTDLWVADESNNRVLGFQQQSGIYTQASYLAGQVDYPFFARNLIEGREVFLVNGPGAGGDVAVDHSSNPPHLYIADTYNHRILGFNDARTVKAGQKADLVIGQSDLPGQPGSAFYRALPNSPQNDPTIQTRTGLVFPAGVLVDTDGSLWVADSGNSRVLRFAAPFAPGNSSAPPNLVLGQQDFTSQTFDASDHTMQSPWGLALFSNHSLAVSDAGLNRILIFKRPSGGDFQNGQSAASVLGQSSFNSGLASNSAAGLSSPRHMGVDTSDRLYVADSGNNRLLVWNNAPNISSGTNSSLPLNNLSQPQSVAVNQATGESWVTLLDGTLIRLPEYNTLGTQSNPNAPPYTQRIVLPDLPYSLALDNSNNLIVAENSNRVTFYYAKLTYQNVASYNGGVGTSYVTPLAPGQLTLLYRLGGLTLTDGHATTNPWPTVMNDLQVMVNGVPAPIFLIVAAAGYVAFQVPTGTPPTGTADFQLMVPSTGEILGAGSFPMAQYNPAFFTAGSAGSGQIAALNDGGSGGINSQTNPVSRDGTHYVSLFLTGGGVFDGGPPDGLAPTQAANTHDRPVMIALALGGLGIAPDNLLTYSGAGAFAGGWQINWTVPKELSPGAQPIFVQIGGVLSNIGANGSKITTVIWVK